MEKIYNTGYRYSNFDPRFDVNGNPIIGAPVLRASDAPPYGWYSTNDVFEQANIAKPLLQIPPESTTKFRLEFDWEAVKDNVRIPRGRLEEKGWLEIFTKDFPENGIGGVSFPSN